MPGTLELLCGPSGVGKTSSLEGKTSTPYTYTTRPSRDEDDAKTRRFVSDEEFERLVQEGEILAPYPGASGDKYGFAADLREALAKGESISEQIVPYDAIQPVVEAFSPYGIIRKKLFLTSVEDIKLRLREGRSAEEYNNRVNQVEGWLHQYLDHHKEFDEIVTSFPKKLSDSLKEILVSKFIEKGEISIEETEENRVNIRLKNEVFSLIFQHIYENWASICLFPPAYFNLAMHTGRYLDEFLTNMANYSKRSTVIIPFSFEEKLSDQLTAHFNFFPFYIVNVVARELDRSDIIKSNIQDLLECLISLREGRKVSDPNPVIKEFQDTIFYRFCSVQKKEGDELVNSMERSVELSRFACNLGILSYNIDSLLNSDGFIPTRILKYIPESYVHTINCEISHFAGAPLRNQSMTISSINNLNSSYLWWNRLNQPTRDTKELEERVRYCEFRSATSCLTISIGIGFNLKHLAHVYICTGDEECKNLILNEVIPRIERAVDYIERLKLNDLSLNLEGWTYLRHSLDAYEDFLQLFRWGLANLKMDNKIIYDGMSLRHFLTSSFRLPSKTSVLGICREIKNHTEVVKKYLSG